MKKIMVGVLLLTVSFSAYAMERDLRALQSEIDALKRDARSSVIVEAAQKWHRAKAVCNRLNRDAEEKGDSRIGGPEAKRSLLEQVRILGDSPFRIGPLLFSARAMEESAMGKRWLEKRQKLERDLAESQDQQLPYPVKQVLRKYEELERDMEMQYQKRDDEAQFPEPEPVEQELERWEELAQEARSLSNRKREEIKALMAEIEAGGK